MGITCQIDDIGPFTVNSITLAPQHAAVSNDPVQAQLGDVTVTKTADVNSPTLAQAAANGTAFDSATITKSDSNGAMAVYQLSSVIIASFQPGSDGSEKMHLSFGKIFMSFTLAGPSTGSSSGGVDVDAISGAG